MTVYFIRRKNDPQGLIKIGFTRNVNARVASLSTATPGGVELLACREGGASLEHELHRRLGEHLVDREWFKPSEAVLAEVELALQSPDIQEERGQDRRKAHTVLPEDEHSESINVETRFYLNELVKREWRGVGDSAEEARNRLMDRFGVSREKARKLWYAMDVSVDGDTYRTLAIEYSRVIEAEGKATENHRRWLRQDERAKQFLKLNDPVVRVTASPTPAACR